MTDRKVSVVLPIYNQEKNLDISLPAVMGQTWDNLEIIAVNDGSTDSSDSIIKNYAKEDSRFVVVEKKNGGLVDATIAGIEAATGDYICFVDPDDVVGPSFVENFMQRIGDCDVVSMGYFENNGHIISAVPLRESKTYDKMEINSLKQNFLYHPDIHGVNNTVYISRWNKLYKTSVIKQILPDLKTIKSVSLGEDTIFTFLMLNYCRKLVCCAEPNCYIYNTDSATSMMKTGQADAHINKAQTAYELFTDILKKYGQDDSQAVALHYFLCSSLISRMSKSKSEDLTAAYSRLHKDTVLERGIQLVTPVGKREKIKAVLWHLPNQSIYFSVYRFINEKLKNFVNEAKYDIKSPFLFLRDTMKENFTQARKLSKSRSKRRNAFKDIKKQLPKLERQISPILEKWKGKKTDFNDCPIEKNIFVFWWDGIADSPAIVKQCFRSIKENHAGYRVIEINKDNYREYTDIHPELLDGFQSGKITVQTFSDILRFNLLKNNGGIWIDSTIFFSQPFDLLKGLETNAINSLEFNSSKYFLEYKNEKCSWSGYYFASRKNSVFVNAMNDIFESYYLQYGEYPIYFFIDAAFMICKINKIDDDALSKTTRTWADMDFLGSNLNETYSDSGAYIAGVVPQKLSWFADIDMTKDSTYYQKLIHTDL